MKLKHEIFVELREKSGKEASEASHDAEEKLVRKLLEEKDFHTIVALSFIETTQIESYKAVCKHTQIHILSILIQDILETEYLYSQQLKVQKND